MLSDLNSNPNSLLEILLISVSVAGCLMCLNISLIALKKSKYSGSILINLQPSSCSVAFCLFI